MNNAGFLGHSLLPSNLPKTPSYTNSYFVQHMDATTSYKLGCSTRATMPSDGGIVVLDFGSPRFLNIEKNPIFDPPTSNYLYGTRLIFPSREYVSLSDIKLMATWFAKGYTSAECAGASFPPIVIALGTSNSKICQNDITNSCNIVDNSALSALHGQKWAEMITELNEITPGNLTLFTGGFDAEFSSPQWNSLGTMEWATGYSNSATASLYNFGDCNDCPRRVDRSQWNAAQMARLDTVYKLSWHLDWAKPLPEIFLNSYQDEWYNVIRYGKEFYPDNKPMILSGVMTDCQFTPSCAMSDARLWTEYAYPSEEGDDFTPAAGWWAMRDTLFASDYDNSDPSLISKHNPSWLTDIQEQP